MNDEFLDQLRNTWHSQTHDTEAVLTRLRRRRWAPHLALGGQVVGCLVALTIGVWFAWMAISVPQQRVLFALGAAVMLIVVPPLCWMSMVVRRSVLGWYDETPQSLLLTGVRRADALMQALRLARWHVAVIGAFVAVLWACQVLGLIHSVRFLIFYTVVCLLAGVGGLLWIRVRGHRARREREACMRLLAMMSADDQDEDQCSKH